MCNHRNVVSGSRLIALQQFLIIKLGFPGETQHAHLLFDSSNANPPVKLAALQDSECRFNEADSRYLCATFIEAVCWDTSDLGAVTKLWKLRLTAGMST